MTAPDNHPIYHMLWVPDPARPIPAEKEGVVCVNFGAERSSPRRKKTSVMCVNFESPHRGDEQAVICVNFDTLYHGIKRAVNCVNFGVSSLGGRMSHA